MPTQKKKEIIDGLEQAFTRCDSGIMTDYRGLKTPDLVALRRKLRDIGVEYHIVKNTLAKIAAEKAGKTVATATLEGTVAIAFVSDDTIIACKTLTEHIRATKLAMDIKGGFMGDRKLSAKDIATLATLPSREILIAKVLGGIQAPLYGLLNQLNAPLRGLAYVLQGRIKQLEGVE